MAKTFTEAVQNAQTGLPLLSPTQANELLQNDPNALILDVRDAGDLNLTGIIKGCLLYTSPSPRDATLSRMPSSA